MASQIPGRGCGSPVPGSRTVPHGGGTDGGPPQIETTEIPVLFDFLHPEVPPLPPETKLEASEEDSPDAPDEATIPNRRDLWNLRKRRCRSTIAIGGSGGGTPPEPGSSEEEKEPGAEPELSMEDSEPALRDEPPSIPFEAVDSPRKASLPVIPEPPIAETIASPKDEESWNEAHEKPVSMPEEKPSLENQEEIPVSLPSPENVPPDAAESSNERESEPDTDAKGDPEPFSLITPEDIPAASSRKQRARVPVRPKPRD